MRLFAWGADAKVTLDFELGIYKKVPAAVTGSEHELDRVVVVVYELELAHGLKNKRRGRKIAVQENFTDTYRNQSFS